MDEDSSLYNYSNKDGSLHEPDFFAPILPMLLVNGAYGIGTGFSQNIPPHCPTAIAENLLHMMEGKEPRQMTPCYRNFKGPVSHYISYFLKL